MYSVPPSERLCMLPRSIMVPASSVTAVAVPACLWEHCRAGSQALLLVASGAPPSYAAELFNISVAAFGLAVFAIEVALLTQLVLDVLESNESRGGKVFEVRR